MRMDLFPTIGTGIWKLNLTSAAMTLVAVIVVLILARLAVRKLSVENPRGMQNVMEWLIDFVKGLAKDTIGEEHAEKYVPLAFALILFLFIANQMGVIDMVSTVNSSGEKFTYFNSPTANINVAMAMSVGIVLMTHIIGLRHPKNYFKHYVQPNAAFAVIHILDEASKFLTLGLRLFGNIFAGEVLISVILTMPMIAGWIPIGSIPLIAWLGYSLFVGTIQAFIFTVLTLVYIGQKLPHAEEH